MLVSLILRHLSPAQLRPGTTVLSAPLPYATASWWL